PSSVWTCTLARGIWRPCRVSAAPWPRTCSSSCVGWSILRSTMADTLDATLHRPEATERLGGLLASVCKAPALVALQGELGAGKTTLARGFLKALGVRDAVKSPTYTLVEP